MSVQFQKNVAVGSLSLTPLIDVVFLLLIFFLVATRFEQEERDMDVELPQASEALPTIASRQELFVNLSADGQFYLGDASVDLPSLEKALQDAYLRNPGRQRVVIRADRDSRTQQLVAVLNACNKANIKNYSVATE